MAKKVYHISLKKSTVAGKIPSSDVLVDGELAVNIAEGGEKIFLRNTKPEIVEFSSDKLLDKKYLSTTSGGTVNGETTFNKDVKIVYPDSGSTPVSLREVMVDNEMAVAAALNDLNTRITEQKTDIDSIKTKEYLPLSGGTVNGNLTVTGTTTFEDDVRITNGNFIGDNGIEIKGVNAIYEFERGDNINVWINNGTTKPLDEFFQTSGGTVNGDLTVTGNTEFNGDVKIVYPDSSSQTVSLREVMVENEKVTASALNDLNERNDELSAKVTEQKTDIDNLSQKYLPLSGGTMSGNMKYSKTETEDNNDKYVTATYSDSIILDKRDKLIHSNIGYNTLSLTNSEIKLHEHSSSVGIPDKDISINNRGLNVNNCGITLKEKNPIGANYYTTTINGDSVTSPQFVKTSATADDILLGDGTTKNVNDFLQTSGGTVNGDTTFTKDVKVVFPNSETPTSLVGAIVSNEKVTSAALNNLNEKVDDHKSDIDNLKAQKNLPLSGGTVTGEATFSGGLKFRYPDVSSTPVSLRDVIADNEEVTAAALNDLNDKINKIGDISISNGVLIINDGNTKYKLNLEQLVTSGYATKE